VSGFQLRSDRLRVVFDRETLLVEEKSIRSASGEYRSESLVDRMSLQAD
jgi:hypothetical protein